MAKTGKKFIYDGIHGKAYARAWKEGKGRQAEIVVQVWMSGTPDGEPDGDWAMPACFGIAAVDQAVLQTEKRKK